MTKDELNQFLRRRGFVRLDDVRIEPPRAPSDTPPADADRERKRRFLEKSKALLIKHVNDIPTKRLTPEEARLARDEHYKELCREFGINLSRRPDEGNAPLGQAVAPSPSGDPDDPATSETPNAHLVNRRS